MQDTNSSFNGNDENLVFVFYSKGLGKKFGKMMKLKKYAVVSIGFERLFFEEITDVSLAVLQDDNIFHSHLQI